MCLYQTIMYVTSLAESISECTLVYYTRAHSSSGKKSIERLNFIDPGNCQHKSCYFHVPLCTTYTCGILIIPCEWGHFPTPTLCWWSNNACAIYLPFQFFPGALPEVPAVLLGVLGVSSREGSHGELVLKDGTGDMICEVRGIPSVTQN